jgi:hypothetical protein
MAESHCINPTPARTHLPDERVQIALESAWEIEACAVEALKLLKDADAPLLAARSLAMRMRDLAGLSMDALQDTGAPVDALARRLTGVGEVRNG